MFLQKLVRIDYTIYFLMITDDKHQCIDEIETVLRLFALSSLAFFLYFINYSWQLNFICVRLIIRKLL